MAAAASAAKAGMAPSAPVRRATASSWSIRSWAATSAAATCEAVRSSTELTTMRTVRWISSICAIGTPPSFAADGISARRLCRVPPMPASPRFAAASPAGVGTASAAPDSASSQWSSALASTSRQNQVA